MDSSAISLRAHRDTAARQIRKKVNETGAFREDDFRRSKVFVLRSLGGGLGLFPPNDNRLVAIPNAINEDLVPIRAVEVLGSHRDRHRELEGGFLHQPRLSANKRGVFFQSRCASLHVGHVQNEDAVGNEALRYSEHHSAQKPFPPDCVFGIPMAALDTIVDILFGVFLGRPIRRTAARPPFLSSPAATSVLPVGVGHCRDFFKKLTYSNE